MDIVKYFRKRGWTATNQVGSNIIHISRLGVSLKVECYFDDDFQDKFIFDPEIFDSVSDVVLYCDPRTKIGYAFKVNQLQYQWDIIHGKSLEFLSDYLLINQIQINRKNKEK